MRQKTLGDFLKEARSSHRISLAALSKRTRIRLQYLEALEENRFTDLPAATFVKGYVKIYSKLFGFDAEPLLALLRRDFKESARGTLVPREFLKPVMRRHWQLKPLTVVALGIVVIFSTILLYLGWQWWELQRPPQLVITQPAVLADVGPIIEVHGRTDADARVTVNNQPVALRPDGQFQTEVSVVNEGLTTLLVEAVNDRGRVTRIERRVTVEF
ncbi:MAG: helix-turn-helix domain-containing protein [Patescibacteria group bacterium]